MGITRSLTRLLARWFTHPVRRRLEGPGRGPRSTRAVSAASPSSRFTRHYTMSQGWQLLSLDSRLRLKLAREELALSLPPNPEDAPLLLTPRPRNHASFSFFPAGFHPWLSSCAKVFFFRWNWRRDEVELGEREMSSTNRVEMGWFLNGSFRNLSSDSSQLTLICDEWSKMIVFRISSLEAAVEISLVFYINWKWL